MLELTRRQFDAYRVVRAETSYWELGRMESEAAGIRALGGIGRLGRLSDSRLTIKTAIMLALGLDFYELAAHI